MAHPFLMYHEISRAGHAPVRTDPGYLRYVLDADLFESHMQWLSGSGLRVRTVSQALAAPSDDASVVLTFDDGCESDATVVAPILKERGLGATFYVVAGWLGTSGFMTHAQVRSLSGQGFEIGSHSMSHAFLADLGEDELLDELSESKDRIEQIVGWPVEHLSCPGGRWSPRVADVAQRIGYRTVATSRLGLNGEHADTSALARTAIFSDTSVDAFAAICRGELPASRRVREGLLHAAKTALGNRAYEALRAVVLRRPA